MFVNQDSEFLSHTDLERGFLLGVLGGWSGTGSRTRILVLQGSAQVRACWKVECAFLMQSLETAFCKSRFCVPCRENFSHQIRILTGITNSCRMTLPFLWGLPLVFSTLC